ncbi:hypothetical protein [Methanofollis tationis]|uniref:HEAT repeat domain-containing protein n=1 Tax=Methanofollis tationis TaxID=81417 RepID=A0A7K4HLR4_9EURY|nr:hypothetical protein [Methanofollis tationis]NVO66215.1 hypothetical protein [Methanofollis tationis]
MDIPDAATVLASGDDEAVLTALHDMLLFKSVNPPAPADLDAVAGVMDRGGRAAETALQVLYVAAVREGTLPAEREAAVGRVRAFLEGVRDDPEGRAAVRHAVGLLACMGDPLAIEQLAYDAPCFDGERVKKEDYIQPAMAAMLRRHDADLAALQASMGETRAAADIGEIREYGREPAAYEERMRLMQEDEVEVL